MSPKLSRSSDTKDIGDAKKSDEVKPKKMPPSPLPKPAKSPEGPRSPASPLMIKSHIPVSKERLKTAVSEKYQRTDDYGKVCIVIF